VLAAASPWPTSSVRSNRTLNARRCWRGCRATCPSPASFSAIALGRLRPFFPATMGGERRPRRPRLFAACDVPHAWDATPPALIGSMECVSCDDRLRQQDRLVRGNDPTGAERGESHGYEARQHGDGPDGARHLTPDLTQAGFANGRVAAAGFCPSRSAARDMGTATRSSQSGPALRTCRTPGSRSGRS
jgi:hypothetical protein